MPAFTVTNTSRLTASTNSSTPLTSPKPLPFVEESRCQASHEAKTRTESFWNRMAATTRISRSDAAHALHHIVRAACAFQKAHEAELLASSPESHGDAKTKKKVLLFLENQEQKLHEDVSNLLADSVERDHRIFVGDEIAKLDLFSVPSAASCPTFANKSGSSFTDRCRTLATLANTILQL